MEKVHDMTDVLHRLEQRHGYLLSLAEKKTEIIQRADVKAIQEVVKLEHTQIKELRQLERERKRATDELVAWYCPKELKESAMTEWLSYLPDEEQGVLIDQRDKLANTIDRLKEQNALNQELLEDGLAVVQSTLQMIQPDDDSVAYSPSGAATAKNKDYHGYSAFDSKA